jgi:Leishmanolysin
VGRGSSFIGSHATFAYQLLGGTGNSVPLETTGGAGTAGAHWSEAVFGDELMTGFIAGVPDPLSIVTIGALQDMGYTVNYSAADAYTLPGGHLVAGAVSDSTGTNAAALVSEADGIGKPGSASAPVLASDTVDNGGSNAGGPRTLDELSRLHVRDAARRRRGRHRGDAGSRRAVPGQAGRVIPVAAIDTIETGSPDAMSRGHELA